MNTLHSSSSFRSSCVIQPRHPKTRLPTTSIERKSFDFSALAPHGSSDDTSGTSSNENAKTNNENRRNSQLQRTKSAKRPSSNIKRKTTSKSFSKSVSVGCEPQVINNSRLRHQSKQTKRLLDTNCLSVDDDLFFRHLQALKEENKRALKTLERLYHFGNKEDENENETSTTTNYKKKTKTSQANSDEGITSDSNASRNSSENGLTQGNGDNGHSFKQRFSSNLRQSNGSNGVNEMPAETVQPNYIYGFNGNGLLKVAETRNGYSQQVGGRHGNGGGGDGIYNENRNGNKELRFERDSDRENLDLENEFSENDVETDNAKNEYSENNGVDDNDDSDGNVRMTSLQRGYSLHEYEENERNLSNGISRHPRNAFFSNHVVNGDNVSDMDKKLHDERERRQAASDSSEDELDEKLKVRAPPSHVNILPEDERTFRGRQSNYDVIANMWNNFSVNDTVPYGRNTAGRRSLRKKHSPGGWSPGVTIQEPFKMTLREEKMKEAKQKKIDRIKDELLQKQLEDEAELKKRVTPVPIPPSTFLPIFSEKQQLEQEKKLQMKEASKQLLKSMEKPFSFTQREEAKNKLKRSQSMSAKIDSTKTSFKANPYPDKIFDLTWKDKEAEQAEYRKIKIKLRSQELLAQSSLPPSMATRGDIKNYRNNNVTSSNSSKKKKKEKNFQPQVHHSIPDFQEMQKKIEMALEARKNQNTPTVCEPFKLHTAQIPTRRSKFNNAVDKTKEPNPPPPLNRPGSSFARSNTMNYKNSSDRRPGSALFRSRSISAHSTRVARSRSVSPVYSVTEAARLRQEHIRQSVEKEKLEKQKLKEVKKQKQREIQKLQKVVAQKTAAQDPTRFREKQTAEKLASFRRAEKERVREYKEFLRSVEQKNENRPLLFERESQTNAKRQAQKRYEEILRRAGIDGKTLEAFIAGDRELHRQLAEQRANESGSDDEDEDEDEEDDDDDDVEEESDDDDDIPLKSDGMGYDVVLKSNNNSRSYDNNSDEEPGNELEDDDEEEDDEDEDEEDDDDEEDEDEDEDEEDDDDSDVAPGADDDDDDEDDDGDHDDDEEDGNDVGYGNGHASDVNEDVDSDGSYKP